MKTKIFTLLLAVAASVGTMFAWDYERVLIGDLYYNLNASSRTAEVTSQNSGEYSGDIVIPSSVTFNSVTYSVTSIGDWAFSSCSGLTSITIPNSVTSIGYGAFSGCRGLTSVTIPNSVTSIGVNAFWDCRGLTSVTIPNSVISIGNYAFEGCSGLTSVTIPNSVTSIGNNAFYECTGLISINVASDNSNYCSVDGVLFNKDKTTLIQYPGGKQGAYTIPNSVTSIGNYAFSSCSGLTSVTIPNSVTSIGNYAFDGCSGLTSVTIPNSVTSIGSSAFRGCTGLTSVTIPNIVTSIGYGAFDSCTGLTSVTIPNSVTSIGGSAFSFCSGLTSVTIPNSVTSIGNYAFEYCTGLTSVTNYATTPQAIDANVFINVNKSTCALYVPAESVEAYQTANVWKDFGNILAIEDTPEPCITASGACGAEGDNLIWTLSCYSVLTISGTGEMKDYEWHKTPWFSNAANIVSVEISDGITSIGDMAFDDCYRLTSVTIPNSVTSIGGSAFNGCTGLTSVTIPNSVISIGNYAFEYCTGLTSVTIPNSVTSIGLGAFLRCIGLTSIDVASDNSNYCSVDGVLFNKDKTTLIQYPGGKQGAYTIPNSVTSIGNNAFYECTGLTSVTIPNSVTSIGNYAFSGCTGLTSVTIPNSVTSIGEGAFLGCRGLTSVTIPNSVTSIGVNAFWGCTGLTSVTIPNSVTSIGIYAFDGCSSLTSVTNYATTPQAINANVFNNVNKSTCALYVPAESVEAYQTANVWKDFGNILAIEDTTEPCITASGTCGAEGDNLTWTLSCDSVLTISGTGKMADYEWNVSPFFSNLSISSVVIEDGVTSIGEYIFNHCSNIKEVVIPNSVTTIGFGAFHLCTSLVTIEIPDSVTSIGESSFCNCTSLTAVTIGSNVTRIEGWAFENNNSLISFTSYCTTPPTIDSNRPAFVGSYRSTCTLYVPAESVEAYQTANGWGVFRNILAIEDEPAPCITASGTCGAEGDNLTWTLSCDSVLTISGTGKMADYEWNKTPWFSNAANIVSVEISDGITSVGQYAFQGCSSLTSVTIPNSITSIGAYAFSGCSGLISVAIPNSVTSIGSNAFASCSSLTSIDVASDNPNYCSVDGVLFNKDKTKLIQYPASNARTEYTIPNSVTSIGSYAFKGCSGLTSVTIPNSVTSIGIYAFDGCSSLTSVTIPNSITSIGAYAFRECTGLTSVVIPNSVTRIGSRAFGACSGLTSVTIPNSVTSIGNYAFYKCTGLTSVTNYATAPQAIDANVFYNVDKSACTLNVPAQSLATYQSADVWKEFGNILPIEDTPEPCTPTSGTCGAEGDNLTWTLSCDNVLTISGTGAMADFNSASEIPWYAYSEAIKSVIIGNGVTSIGRLAFYGCWSLTSIEIPNSVTSIGEYAFGYCSMYSVTIPNSVISIGNYAFFGCHSLISVTIPNSVTSIGNLTFAYCTGLTAINVDTDNPQYTSIDGVLFNKDKTTLIQYPGGRQGTYTIPSSVTNIGTAAFAYSKSLTSIEIPNSVTSIGEYAFWETRGLTSVTIPNSVTSIGVSAFSGCTGLISIDVASDNSNYCSIDGVLFNKDKTTLIQYPGGKQGAYTIPNSVTSIGEAAFAYCSGLTSVVIPNSVTRIGSSAFSGCTGLRSVTIPNSVTSIGNYAFCDCSNLNTVTIGNSVTDINKYAFAGCTGLTTIELPSSVTSIGSNAFWDCTGLTSVTCFATTPPQLDYDYGAFDGVDKSIPLYVPAGSVSAYKSAEGWKEFTNILPIGAQPVDVTTTTVTPSETTADIAWPQVTGAATYTIEIKKNGELICTLTFNAQGQLISIAFAAPSRNNAPQQTQAAGFSFTVTSLDSGTTYSYTMTAKDNNGNVLKTESGTFTTTGEAQGIEEISSSLQGGDRGRLIYHEGQIFIFRGDKIYTTDGRLVR